MTQRGEGWFWHILALALGQTVGELQRKMTQVEFINWIEFYRAHPFDDLHRYHRPAAVIAKSMSGGDINDIIDWLHPPEWQEDFDAIDIKTIKAFGLTR